MKKRKQDQIDGLNLWEIEINFLTNKRGIDREKAKTFVIMRWLWNGDARPLVAAIDNRDPLDQAVLNLLAELIDRGRVIIKPRKRGAPKRPDKFARDTVAALAYEAHSGNSEEAFAEIADAIGMSEQSVRQAVTAWRKANVK
jgi:hypothetical protein